MTMEFTPGPWDIGLPNHSGPLAVGITGGGWIVADVWRDEPEIPCEANARLIAAAPDLYAALKALTKYDDGDWRWAWDHQEEFDAARAALAKAEKGK